MARATVADVIALLVAEGATEDQEARIVGLLEAAELNPPRMRTWLGSPDRSYGGGSGFVVSGVDFRQVPTHAIESGHVDAVIAAAEAFSEASPHARSICLTCLCALDQAQRFTHSDRERTAMVTRIAEILLKK